MEDRLTDALVREGQLAERDLARAQAVATQTSGRLPSTLVRLGLVDERDMASQLAEVTGLALAERIEPDETALAHFNHRYLTRYGALPLAIDETSATIAIADPTDESLRAGLCFALPDHAVTFVVAPLSDLTQHLAIPDSAEPEVNGRSLGEGDDVDRLLEGESEAPIIRFVDRLLNSAADRRASDIHIEPMARSLVVRFRIDGRLVEVERHGDAIAGPVASRIKVLAGLDIAETRLPQDGRLRLAVRGRDLDVRVATSPTAWGESIVLRLLGQQTVPLDLERLGLPAPALERLVRALEKPHGILLVTGPTGSGKSTTLYAAINRLKRPDVKILTVEDPVEVLIEGVNQVQVRPEIELSYAATLRAFLRQDPDILMIGEIRDGETAEIAMRAALTGHLVLSTLHTNSAIGAFTRLADIGVQPFLTASTVIAAIAQRLIRKLCPHCAANSPPTADELALYAAAEMPVPASLKRPSGCPSCAQTGYAGRTPLIEILEADDRIRAAIRDGEVERLADERPASETLLGHGLALAASGVTSIEEVRRVVDLQ